MDLWKYYDGDLKYPDLTKHTRVKEVAKVTPRWAYEYAKKHGKDEELESIIAKDAEYSYEYSEWVLHGPFPLGEKAIAASPYYSFWYAKFILKGPFPLGEPAISKNVQYSKKYTQEVLKKDFYLDGKLICKYEG